MGKTINFVYKCKKIIKLSGCCAAFGMGKIIGF
jgi:hypothetical protein